MTDRRLTDLAYGHVGEATYDVDEQNWTFSRDPAPNCCILPLGSLEECIPAASPDLSDSEEKPTESWYLQKKWLLKTVPEVVSATTVLASLRPTSSTADAGPRPSTLLAVGKALNLLRKSESSDFQVMAMAHGEAGNVLRLIKPRVEALGWGGKFTTKLISLNPASSEECYWLEGGGPIQRICFAADNRGPAAWLAVQKAEYTTIFRPRYHQSPIPPRASKIQSWRCPASRLDANPILTLKPARTGSRPHADVSFNPWYNRQFAIVDQRGCWGVWDIEGQERKRTDFEANPGKSGHIHDGTQVEENIKAPDCHDGWGRILWSGGVNTLAVLDRRHLAIFDINVTPRRLYSPDVVDPDCAGWVLDARRSPVNLNHIFVLTTSRIIWLQVTAAGEDQEEQNGHIGARILLSCPHFRNEEDETAQLELIKEEDVCNVFLYSSQNLTVNTYRFYMTAGSTTTPVFSQGSFTLSSNLTSSSRSSGMIQSLSLLPTSFKLHHLRTISGPAEEYVDNGTRFFQLFCLSMNSALHHTFCATRWQISEGSKVQHTIYQTVLTPTVKDKPSSRVKQSSRFVEDDFIVPDELDESAIALDNHRPNRRTPLSHTVPDRRWRGMLDEKVLSINASSLFDASFMGAEFEDTVEDDDSGGIAGYIGNMNTGIETRIDQNQGGLSTFCELAEYKDFSEDIDEASSRLENFMEFLREEDPSNGGLTIKALTPSLLVNSTAGTDANGEPPDLSTVYDMMVSLWIGPLPGNVPGSVRLAKERIVRSAAAELYLSSFVAMINNKPLSLNKPEGPDRGVDFVLPVRVRDGPSQSSSNYNTPITSSMPMPSSPPTAKVHSLSAEDDSQPTEAPEEDESISRLRSYAISIKSLPPLGVVRSTILAHWPAAPGSDPATYSWEAAPKIPSGDDGRGSDDEESLSRKKEQDRRRRRTENFLKRQRANTSEPASQPFPNLASASQPAFPQVGFGSQPDLPRHMVSSQSVELAMTQPDRGVFGSRPGQKSSKKRRTKGF